MKRNYKKSACLALAIAITTSGCAATRFSPPNINMDTATRLKSDNFGFCRELNNWKVEGKNQNNQLFVRAGEGISEDFKGAMHLIDNFVIGYRCAARSAAEGRANFQVPAFLFAATAALGQPFGISEDATIGLAAAGIGATQGNSYFAPQAKADYLNSAIDAITCIQLEAVGIPGLDINAPVPTTNNDEDGQGAQAEFELTEDEMSLIGTIVDKVEIDQSRFRGEDGEFNGDYEGLLGAIIASENLTDEERAGVQAILDRYNSEERRVSKAGKSGESTIGKVPVSAQQQYFRLIAGSLLSVERVLARRLNHAGTPFDPAGVLAQSEVLNNQIQDNKDGDGTDDGDGDQTTPKEAAQEIIGALDQEMADGQALSDAQREAYEIALNSLVIVETKELQPKLQKCVLLAKI